MSLLMRVRNPSDAESWREFVCLYEPLLLSYLRKQGLQENDAQDVLQEVLIALMRKLPQFELDHDRGRFRTWLWRVTHNALVDWARRRNRRDAAEMEAGQEYRAATERDEPEPEWFSDHHRRVLDFSLERVRERTNDVTWKCFDLHIVQGLPSAKVAELLGLTTNAVYVYASRVLAKVRQQCAEYCENLVEA